MINITPALMNALFQGFKTNFNVGMLNPTDIFYLSLCTVVSSTTSEELYGWLANSTAFREWNGDRYIQSLRTEGYTLSNREFENTVGVKQKTIEDDRFGVLSPMFQQLGQDAREHPDTVVFDLIKDAVNAKCFDGKPYFAPNHPVRMDANRNKVTDVSNLSTEAGDKPFWYVFDTSKVLKPLIWQKRKDYNFVRLDAPTDSNVFMKGEALYGSDARVEAGFGMWQCAHASNKALTAANFQAVRTAMLSIKRDNGRPANVKPVEIHVPTYWLSSAEAVFDKKTLEGGEDNTLYKAVKIVHNPYLN